MTDDTQGSKGITRRDLMSAGVAAAALAVAIPALAAQPNKTQVPASGGRW